MKRLRASVQSGSLAARLRCRFFTHMHWENVDETKAAVFFSVLSRLQIGWLVPCVLVVTFGKCSLNNLPREQ